jgi:hypothetical protein
MDPRLRQLEEWRIVIKHPGNIMSMQRRPALLAAALLLATSTTLYAQAPAAGAAKKYGVITLLGDTVAFSAMRPVTGSKLMQNELRFIPIPDAPFDPVALRTVQESLKRTEPQTPVSLYRIKAPQWVDSPNSLFVDGKVQFSPKLISMLQADGATHLIVVTRYRAPVAMRFASGFGAGDGSVEGVGYYIDRSTLISNVETSAPSKGYIAPHVFLRLSLVDLSNASVIRQELVKESKMIISKLDATTTDPWDALSGPEKIQTLSTMIETSLTSAIPALLKDGPRSAN